MTTSLFPCLKSPELSRAILRYSFLALLLLWMHGVQAQCNPDITPPLCQAPASITVSCANFDPSLWVYGEAQASDACCLGPVTETTDYSQFDATCNRGTITRVFKALDCSGNSALATQTIVVQYEQNYFIKFPDDVITPTPNPTSQYGEPDFGQDDCELTGANYVDEVFFSPVDSSIRLERRWTIVNWCTYNPGLPVITIPNPNPDVNTYSPLNLPGPIVSLAGTPAPWASTVVKIAPGDPLPTDYSSFYVAEANAYIYTQIIIFTDTLVTAVNGKVFIDTLANCTFDAGEPLLANWVVKASSANHDYFANTGANGEYWMAVSSQDTSLEISLLSPLNLLQNCPAPYTVHTTAGQSTVQDLPATLNQECPLLTVDISAPFIRRCTNNHYTITACNLGASPAENVSVQVHLDVHMEFLSAGIPGTALGNNTWSFPVGDLGAGECVHFNLNYLLACDVPLGVTHCSEAQIFPDTLCGSNAQWSGADIRVEGYCDGDSVRLEIANIGTGDMVQPLEFVVVEDVIMVQDGAFQLNKDERLNFSVPANGATWRLQAQQEPYHPWGGPESIAVEGCGGIHETGLVTMFPFNNPNPFTSRDCQQNVGSYDPNDKQAFPSGFGDDHMLEANTDLEYMIRFQNTGTDTAFKVVVLDTLSTLLDPASVRPGTSSHTYAFELLDNHILKFQFDNILLPDSNVNEAASHGFFKFRVAQKPDNPLGSKIENSGAIYFDFNDPVITNTVFHTIGEHFVLSGTNSGPAAGSIQAYPNPAGDLVFFDLPAGKGQFTLRNQLGQLIRSSKITQSPFRFERGALPSGVYFFNIQMEDQRLFTGKVILK